MNWDLLKSFEAVAERGSLSAAARHLKLSPATVGRHVQVLEQQLDTKLFDHLPDGYAMTMAGQEFFPMARDMAAVASRIERKRRALVDAEIGSVRIAGGNWFSQLLLRNLGKVRTDLPGVELEVINSYEFANLSRLDADIAIRNRRPERGRVAVRKLPGYAWEVYGHKDYVKAHPDSLTEARFDTCAWIGFIEENAHLPSARWLAERLKRSPDYRCAQAMNILDGVLGGGALGVLPCFIAGLHDTLVPVNQPFAISDADAWMVIHEDLRRIPAIRRVADWIVLLMKEQTAG